MDTNLLVYAHRGDAPWHREAKECLASVARAGAWGIPWSCAHEFLAITTHAGIFKPPTPQADALVALETWLGPMGAVALHETDGYLGVLRRVLETSRATGAKVHDARIAATCMLHGVEVLLTADRDFGSFTGLRTRNPLVRAGGKP